jgi:hypothetical protein
MIRPNSLYNPIRASIKKPELSRLLSAAVINSQFCNMLLNDPVTAAQEGYEDERFCFNHKEMEKLSAIHAASLKDFAAELAAI